MTNDRAFAPRGLRRAVAAGLALLVPAALAGCGAHEVHASLHQDASSGRAESTPVADAPAAEQAPEVATVGKPAPDFELEDLAGEKHRLSEYTAGGKLVVLEWINPDCPISKAYHHPKNDMVALAAEFQDKGVVWLAVNSGAEGKQGAGLERNLRAVEEYGITYPVLLDMSGAVGHRYEAKTTPHMYVVDTEGVLRYAGAIDDGNPRAKGEVNYVRRALQEILAGKPVSTPTSKPFGCSVKYGS